MAKGRSTASGWLVAGLIVVITLASTGMWNPFPGIWDWINTSATISDPAPRWQERLGGRPRTVETADDTAIADLRESVEARSLGTGAKLWSAPADWVAVAGPPGHTVVITGELLIKGYSVLDPRTGAQLRHDDRAVAVWTWSNMMLDVACRKPQDCVLTAREPDSGHELWQVNLPGVGFVLFADNPELLNSKPMETDQADSRLTGPGRMPPVLGFPIEGKVHVVDTVAGRLLREIRPKQHEKILVIGGRVVHSEATPISAGCELHLIGRDAVTGRAIWRRDGYNLNTVSGSACDQDRDPLGAGSALLAVRPDGRQVLLDSYDGREVLICPRGAKIVATDGVRAIVRGKDGSTLTAYQLGEDEPLWSRKADREAGVALTRTAALIFDHKPDRILVLDPDRGQPVLEMHSDARAVALAAQGLLLSDHRDLGLLPLPGGGVPVQGSIPSAAVVTEERPTKPADGPARP